LLLLLRLAQERVATPYKDVSERSEGLTIVYSEMLRFAQHAVLDGAPG